MIYINCIHFSYLNFHEKAIISRNYFKIVIICNYKMNSNNYCNNYCLCATKCYHKSEFMIDLVSHL